MKEKIFSKLKLAVSDGKNGLTSIAEKTLHAYAEIYGKKITDESQIDAEVDTIVSLLKETQANINSTSAKAVAEREKALKAEYEKTLEELKTKKAETEPGASDKETEKLLAEWKAVQEKLAAYEKKDKQQERKTEIVSGMKELGLTEDDMRYVTVPEDRDVKEFLTDYRQHLVDRGLKPLEEGGRKDADPKDAQATAQRWMERIAVSESGKN
ncbi:MAG: hypothetical protein LBP50_03210 [Tannerella sp.]|jgi:hypothetical protein|nr:hypothetical protein [Tannerella sp.]